PKLCTNTRPWASPRLTCKWTWPRCLVGTSSCTAPWATTRSSLESIRMRRSAAANVYSSASTCRAFICSMPRRARQSCDCSRPAPLGLRAPLLALDGSHGDALDEEALEGEKQSDHRQHDECGRRHQEGVGR